MPDKRTAEEISQLEADAAEYEDNAKFYHQNEEPVLHNLHAEAADATRLKIDMEE